MTQIITSPPAATMLYWDAGTLVYSDGATITTIVPVVKNIGASDITNSSTTAVKYKASTPSLNGTPSLTMTNAAQLAITGLLSTLGTFTIFLWGDLSSRTADQCLWFKSDASKLAFQNLDNGAFGAWGRPRFPSGYGSGDVNFAATTGPQIDEYVLGDAGNGRGNAMNYLVNGLLSIGGGYSGAIFIGDYNILSQPGGGAGIAGQNGGFIIVEGVMSEVDRYSLRKQIGDAIAVFVGNNPNTATINTYADNAKIQYINPTNLQGSGSGSSATQIVTGKMANIFFTGPAIGPLSFDMSGYTGAFGTDITLQVDSGTYYRTTLNASVDVPSSLISGSGTHQLKIFIDRDCPADGTIWTGGSATVFLGLNVPGGTTIDTPTVNLPRVLFVGDSITEGIGRSGDPSAWYLGYSRYGQQAEYWFPCAISDGLGAEAINMGYPACGLSTTGYGVPITTTNIQFVMSGVPYVPDRVDTVFTYIGTNDFAHVDAPTFASLYNDYIAEVRSFYGADVPLYCVAVPNSTSDYTTALSDLVDSLVMAGDAHLFFIDMSGSLVVNPATRPTGDTVDGTHGNQVYSDKVTAAALDIIPPFSATLPGLPVISFIATGTGSVDLDTPSSNALSYDVNNDGTITHDYAQGDFPVALSWASYGVPHYVWVRGVNVAGNGPWAKFSLGGGGSGGAGGGLSLSPASALLLLP